MMYSFSRMMWHHVRSQLAAAAFLLASAAVVFGQSAPPTMPDKTVYGRLGTGTGSGPAQAIPFNTLANQLFPTITSGKRIVLTGNQTFYVNGNPGSTATCGIHGTSAPLTCSAGNDANDCLTPASACLTSNRVFSLILQKYDSAGFNIVVNGAHCASSSCGVNLAFACVGSPIGATTLSFSGDYDNPTAVEIFAPNGGDAISANDQCTVSIDSIAIADQGSAVHGFYVPKLAQLDVRSVTVTGTWNTGACIFCAGGADALLNVIGVGNGGITNTLATTSTGQVFQAASGGQINFAGQTVAIPSAITVGAGQAFGFNLGGSIIGISSGTFTGSGVGGTTGLRCLSFDSFWGNVDPNTVFPGNTNCTMTRTFNSVNIVGPLTSTGAIVMPPITTSGVTFSGLPGSPAAGTFAYITDGKASNCGDSSCTTFGTAVTAGTGALPLFIWYTGAAWHLVGK